jgi:hypothetical protein
MGPTKRSDGHAHVDRLVSRQEAKAADAVPCQGRVGPRPRQSPVRGRRARLRGARRSNGRDQSALALAGRTLASPWRFESRLPSHRDDWTSSRGEACHAPSRTSHLSNSSAGRAPLEDPVRDTDRSSRRGEVRRARRAPQAVPLTAPASMSAKTPDSQPGRLLRSWRRFCRSMSGQLGDDRSERISGVRADDDI